MERIIKRLVGAEDISWDTTGEGQTDNFFTSWGQEKELHKINESHIPLSLTVRQAFPESEYLDDVLITISQQLANNVGSSGGGGSGGTGSGGSGSSDDMLSGNLVVNFYSNMSTSEMKTVINNQLKNLGGHTLTFRFPENSTIVLTAPLDFSDFYNGKLLIDGNNSVLQDSGDLTGLLYFSDCSCRIDVNNCTINPRYSSNGIVAIFCTPGLFLDCLFSGDSDKYALYVSSTNAEFSSDAAFAGGIKKITGFIYKYLLPQIGGTMTGTIIDSVEGNIIEAASDDVIVVNGGIGGSLYLYGGTAEINPGAFNLRAVGTTSAYNLVGHPDGRLTWGGHETGAIQYHICRMVNGVRATDNGNISITAANVGALSTAGGTMTGTIIDSVSGNLIEAASDDVIVINGGIGGSLYLYGGTAETNPGAFNLRSVGTTSAYNLIGHTNGQLTWGGHETGAIQYHICRMVNKVTAGTDGNITITPDNIGAVSNTGGLVMGTLNMGGVGNVEPFADSAFAYSGIKLTGSPEANSEGIVSGVYVYNLLDDSDDVRQGAINFAAADKDNMSWFIARPNGEITWRGKDITLGYPNYAAGVTFSGSTYTATADGWIYASIQTTGIAWVSCYVNGGNVKNFGHGGGYDHGDSIFIPVKEGDVFTYNYSGTFVGATCVFYPNR